MLLSIYNKLIFILIYIKMGKSKDVWAICAGHGGMLNGKYETAPNYSPSDPSTWKKMYVHPNGLTLFEGVFNREVKDMLLALLENEGIEFVDIVPEQEDISLGERLNRLNKLYQNNKNIIWVEIHGNAGKGTGFEVFTTKGKTNSDYVAEMFIDELMKEFPEKRARIDISDGDKDKEANFYLIRKVPCPAILTENFFFDNLKDAELMQSYEGKKRIAFAHFRAIKEIEKLGIAGLKEKYSF
jgi:N-acetylmuramoyl-L-alanine amidase